MPSSCITVESTSKQTALACDNADLASTALVCDDVELAPTALACDDADLAPDISEGITRSTV